MRFTRFWCQIFELEMVLVLKKLQISGMHCHMFRIVPCEECQVDVLQKDKVRSTIQQQSAGRPDWAATVFTTTDHLCETWRGREEISEVTQLLPNNSGKAFNLVLNFLTTRYYHFNAKYQWFSKALSI